MNITAITPQFSIAPAMAPDDVVTAAARGFRALVGAAPDADRDGPSDSDILREQAANHGLSFAHTPVVIGLIGQSDIDAFAAALAQADGPVLAFCHSGLRATLLWALASRKDLGEEAVIAAAARAGFDIADYLGENSEALLAA